MTDNKLNNDQNKLLIFLHIPKTGGTTLTNIIRNQYLRNISYSADRSGLIPSGVLDYKDELEKASTLCGHFWFGVHNYFSRSSIYITMLRNPIDQVISWFYFKYKNPQYNQFDSSFEEYISSDEFNYFTDNVQTHFICGDGTADLERAKQNLTKYFSVVGITELFDESVFIMKKELGWNNIDYSKENSNPSRPNRNQISKLTINKIKEKNKIDLELYNFARKILENKIRALGFQDRQELDIFKSTHKGL
ncbi:sulfotransferase family 2 domain-containing protein [Paramaledivibacter caminithermalis]|jgi:hypothetical protein|uniref:Sulfotransferase family protein n=1 Tax=Paramaledivibacter caminithermalis (strain DSM 15212 / CIP 107654 / DViRD3) TaxID=1121301 RepID=A0A1M6JTS9_PARC5|nr:sulfotransferase family 2 domain-containing protein [Paramaledivibacter caminithermalis]SHJ50081.1 Sulfotransferase family protein [Paramaledivibacter caminithermalis DSM 15212]